MEMVERCRSCDDDVMTVLVLFFFKSKAVVKDGVSISLFFPFALSIFGSICCSFFLFFLAVAFLAAIFSIQHL